MEEQTHRLPLIGERAPAFVAESTFSHIAWLRTIQDRVEKAGTDYRCLDWFLCLKKDPGR